MTERLNLYLFAQHDNGEDGEFAFWGKVAGSVQDAILGLAEPMADHYCGKSDMEDTHAELLASHFIIYDESTLWMEESLLEDRPEKVMPEVLNYLGFIDVTGIIDNTDDFYMATHNNNDGNDPADLIFWLIDALTKIKPQPSTQG